jgi:hypothetical protein
LVLLQECLDLSEPDFVGDEVEKLFLVDVEEEVRRFVADVKFC